MFLKSALVVATLFVAELALYIAAANQLNPLLISLICIGLSVLGVRLAFPGFLTGAAGLLFVGPVRGVVASSLGTRLASLLPAGALGGHSNVRRNVRHFGFRDVGPNDVVDVTFTMKDPSPASSSAHAGGGDASTRELSAHGT